MRHMEITDKILNMLTQARNVDEGVQNVLSYLGHLWQISRVYVFETTEDGEAVNNTYEWCAEGIVPMIDRLQNMSLKEYGYDTIFMENDMFNCPDITKLPKATKEELESQNVRAIAQCAIMEHGIFRGFIGLDDCVRIREDWRADSEESKSLRYVSRLLSMYLIKERSVERLRMAREAEVTHNVQLATERTQYRDALSKNAVYSFHFDVTDGNLTEEIIDRDGNSWMRDAGLCVPCDYDVQCKIFKKRFGVEFLDENAVETFSKKGLLQMFESGLTSETFEYYQRNTDTYIRILVLLSKDIKTNHIHATIFSFDITKKRKAELDKQRILKEALAQAEHANRAKTIFLNNMSHDIRTPMNAIIGFTTLASEHVNNTEKISDYLKKIQTSSKHLLSLINDVLDMSRIESGKVQIEESEISLFEVVRDIRDIVQADARAKELNLLFNIESVKNENVWCDRLRLNQILLNCMSNAIKFTPAGGTIEMKIIEIPCRAKGYSSYEFKIRDTGIGMTPEFMEHIFEAFERERTSTVSGIQGTGLGMSITKNIVDMMGGKISVESEKDKGSEFTIFLTLRLTSARKKNSGTSSLEFSKTAAPDACESETDALNGVHILLVEDNEMNREIAMEILTELGASVEISENGETAVERVQAAEPGYYDVVLMDVQMPVMDGFTATRRIRELSLEYAKLPIIAMTANAFEEDRKTALACGMDGYIAKPIDVRNIVKTITTALQLKEPH